METLRETDKFAVYRQQVAEKNESQNKMSETAKAKLRALNEHERQGAAADSRLVKEFNSGEWSVERLMDLFASAFGGAKQSPRRRAVKAAYRLMKGMKVYHINDLSLFGELLPDETENNMRMSKFLARYPLPEPEAVTPAKPAKPENKPERAAKERLCKSGSKCIWKRRKAALSVGRSLYCTPVCQQADRARQRRASVTQPTAVEASIGSLAAA